MGGFEPVRWWSCVTATAGLSAGKRNYLVKAAGGQWLKNELDTRVFFWKCVLSRMSRFSCIQTEWALGTLKLLAQWADTSLGNGAVQMGEKTQSCWVFEQLLLFLIYPKSQQASSQEYRSWSLPSTSISKNYPIQSSHFSAYQSWDSLGIWYKVLLKTET